MGYLSLIAFNDYKQAQKQNEKMQKAASIPKSAALRFIENAVSAVNGYDTGYFLAKESPNNSQLVNKMALTYLRPAYNISFAKGGLIKAEKKPAKELLLLKQQIINDTLKKRNKFFTRYGFDYRDYEMYKKVYLSKYIATNNELPKEEPAFFNDLRNLQQIDNDKFIYVFSDSLSYMTTITDLSRLNKYSAFDLGPQEFFILPTVHVEYKN
ncbi:hypothetical protein [Ligilactobacillus equi]|uniref:Uncharacterized protein n=1 Tax=Ligilactobacillus equi DSM 15833 = JCM 10991 TaxID=1423740 RepID=A0A0R1TG94_9LACO|nr:hypothetical protein [Ligilactobacillus equi]KRL78122.1 hypothetical protein FC36_GL001172 [Ligilactobacillus equi DSM 15833 = JCM 10991]